MSIETPKNKPEEIGSIEESESVIEMSPEDFQEMIDQLPILKDMLQERETKLENLKKDASANVSDIEALKTEIEELRQEIAEREELIRE